MSDVQDDVIIEVAHLKGALACSLVGAMLGMVFVVFHSPRSTCRTSTIILTQLETTGSMASQSYKHTSTTEDTGRTVGG